MDIRKKTLKRNNGFEIKLVLISVILGSIFFFVPMIRDDQPNLQFVGNNMVEAWRWSVYSYNRWSSRIFIYFIGAVVLQKGALALGLYMIVSYYVFLKALVLLFPKTSTETIFPFILASLLLFPYDTQFTAGWIATLTSYLGPHAFALMGLVPIKKVLSGQKSGVLENLFYAICLIYGANVEQMCVVLVAAYLVANAYLLWRRKGSAVLIVMLLVSIASLVNIFVCPGNHTRSVAEELNWFPTYQMMDLVDKADVGISTTLKWFYVDNVFTMFFCLILALLMWSKYKEKLFRIIALFVAVVSIALGPLRILISSLFPYAGNLASEVNYYGAFNVMEQGCGPGMYQFGILLCLTGLICVEIVLLNDSIKGLLADLTLFLAGFASRAMMGFSPTIYASGSRTFTSLMICFIVIGIHLYSDNSHYLDDNNALLKCDNLSYVFWVVSMIGFINLFYMIITVAT